MVMRVPEYNQQHRYESPQVPAARLKGMDVQTSADMFGAQSGKQMEKAGYLVQRGGDQLSHLVDDYNTTKAQDAARQMQQGFLDWQSEAQKKQGEAGMNTATDYDSWAKTKRDELTKGMSDVQRGRFDSLANMQDARFRHWADGYGHQQGQAYHISTQKGRVSNNTDMLIKNIHEPALAEIAVDQLYAAGLRLSELSGNSRGSEAEQAIVRETVSSALTPAIHARIQSGETGLATTLMKQYAPQLGGAAMAQLGAANKRMQEHQAAQARADQTLRRMEARQIASLAPDRLSYAAQTGDFTAVEQAVGDLEKMGAGKEAAELRGSIDLQRTANTITDGLRGTPLLQAEAEAQKAFDARKTPDNAIEVGKAEEKVARNIANHKAAFLHDPAAYAQHVQPLDPATPTRERFKRTLETQAHLGQGMDYAPQLLPKAQQLKINNEYESIQDGTKKLQYVRGLQQDSGEYFSQLAREVKLPDAVTQMAPVLANLPDKMGGALLMAAEIKKEDIPRGNDETAWKDAKQTAASSSLAQVYHKVYQSLPADSGNAALAKSMEDTLSKAALMGVDLNALDGQFDIANDSNLHIAIPKHLKVNMDSLEYAIQVKSGDLQRNRPKEAPPKDFTGYATRLWQGNLDRLASEGFWVSDDSGEVVYLVDPATGNRVPDADGSPVHIRTSELESYEQRVSHELSGGGLY